MDLRTTLNIDPSISKISYKTPAMFIGSCFASEIGKQMEDGKLPVLINPSGSVYNPVSVANTIEFIIRNKKFSKENLYNHKGQFISFYHYTDFSSEDIEECLFRINEMTARAHAFLSTARFLFITFGTARIYKFRQSGEVVSNCHKLPSDYFLRDLLSVEDIVTRWKKTLDDLKKFNDQLNVIFTISPVRHWKDGAHGNQVSKSVLFLSVEELLNHSVSPQYFPAYELLMDDLRDYRFYDEDMLHPSNSAINYIWKAFSGCYLDARTISIWNEVVKITKACNHRINTDTGSKIYAFSERMLKLISDVGNKEPAIDFSRELNYFLNLLQK
jgi:hypothetical protein